MLTKRLIICYVVIIIAYATMLLFALMIGEEYLSIKEVLFALFSDNEHSIIVRELRLPRIILAILIGMLLASSGAITQNIFSNPIADPYIIGIASAASFGAIMAYMFKLPDYYFGIFGFICSCLFSLLIFMINNKHSIATLLIIGIAISSFLGGITSLLIYYIGEDSFKVVMWLMGYLGLASWNKISIIIAPLIFCLIYFYLHRNDLNIILSGDEEARNLGVDSVRLKLNMLVISSLAVSFGIAFSGLIGFVGLIIPHIIRVSIKSYNMALVLPLCTLLGGVFLLFCDTLSRSIISPIEIPIGVVSAFFGAPIFLYLTLNSRRGF
ncbi:iron ABC transporter permease [Helicobacter sp. MIT 14-3879]|uniref:FecCD family ABC transporter permease n=1 Tax=Helicobacter sp. MIT 14-3879 TaxID=2040649 RepID=UPI000E1F9C36|nr:iron ABC transporter permease [Helicobacter sp. MIT 14-3879]RDU65125.1 iron ABC transporter [Helicobacter sp. MIT 14-3879]